MRNTHFALIALVLSVLVTVDSQTPTNAGDAAAMQLLKGSLKIPSGLDWSAQDPCQWEQVQCSDGRVTGIQIGSRGVSGSVPDVIKNLTSLARFELYGNSISGPLPSLSGLSLLVSVLVNNNNFSSVPPDFFSGLSSLQTVSLDGNPLASCQIPESINGSGSLKSFSANSANIGGSIPVVFSGDNFPNLVSLHLAMNRLEGPLPRSFSGWSSLQSIWLNGLKGSGVTLNGSIEVLGTMDSLSEIWLNTNSFSGPVPDFSNLTSLTQLSLRDNQFTGPVPPSLVSMKTLKVVNLTNNMLQGPMPQFDPLVVVDMFPDTNSFCLPKPGNCDSRVNTLLSFAKNLGYPATFAQDWKGNDPCVGPWRGITCDNSGNITVVNFQKRGLTGTISPDLSQLQSLQRIILSNNNLYGPIPDELTSLKNLIVLDLSNNNLSGKVPSFRFNVITEGNPNIGKNILVPPSPGAPGSGSGSGSGSAPDVGPEKKKSSKIGVIVGLVVGVCAIVIVAALFSLCLWRKKQNRLGKVRSPNATLHPRHSGSGSDMVKITVAAPGPNAASSSEAFSHTSGDSSDVHVVEANHMVISIQVLRNVTNNFSEQNILGRGGFGTVYKGELHDGTKIAVKRMESGVLSEKGLNEFKSEIALVTKVRHRHLVNLVGYCLDGNERLLVYEYMPQGTLSRHLFHWKEEGLKPLEWTRRLAIALDVARGVEYLHNLAQQSYIHRDLKPSNILLDDDMRAKVADFGLARLAPNGKDYSIQTKLAGTFGYLAPEYAVTGRVTTKSDVFSFGVILMELITGRRALDENEPEESMHLVTWFKRMQVNKDTSKKAIDSTIDLTEETLANISIVAELAGHCCAREAQQRPDMSRVVNVLSSLAEQWKPIDPVSEEDIYGIDLEMTLPQALKRWQAFEGNSYVEGNSSSSLLPSGDNTQTSIPTRPSGFAESFRSEDGR